ncbi:MAG: hypothetical protein QM667_11855 [Asticcacaulis sp.]
MSFTTFLKGAALAVAALALGCSAAAAADAPKLNDKQRAKGVADAPAYIKGAGVPCELSDAYFIGESTVKSADGKSSKLQVLEVSCKAGGGFILNKNVGTGAYDDFNCTQAFSQNAANPKAIKCILPANDKHYVWLTPVAQKLDPACTVDRARWIGGVPAEKYDRYEVGCQGGAGFVMDVPYGDSKIQPSIINCLMAKGGYACQLTTADQAARRLQPVVTQANSACTVEKARWLGRIASENSDYFEIGCAGRAGFILQTDTNMKYKANYGCDRAGTLGPCQYTNTAAVTADMRDTYAAKLTALKVSCTISEFNIMGVENSTKRELVEFKCPEHKFGLVALLQADGATVAPETMDCFTLTARRRECTFVTRAQLDQQINTLIKTVKQDCDVKQVSYLGRSDIEDGVLVEIACVNKRGYIADIAKTRVAFNDAVPCAIARSRKYDLQCQIPENGTYVPPAGAKD